MAALTFYEMIKDMKDPVAQAASFVYAKESPVLTAMTFETRRQGVMKNTLIVKNPYTASSAAYRAFDAEFSTTKAPKQKFAANVVNAGGRFEFDRDADYMNPEETQIQMEGQLRANVRILSKDIFEGTGANNGLYGIDAMIDNWALWSGQTVAGGNALLSLTMLDTAMALHNVQPGRTFIFLASNPFLYLKILQRGVASTQYNTQWLPEQWGKDPKTYGDIPVIRFVDGTGTDYFTDSSGINGYIVTFGPEDFAGFQVRPPYVSGNNTNSVIVSNSYNWQIGTMPKSIKCITRIDKIKDATS